MGEEMFKTTDEKVRWQRRKKVGRRDGKYLCVGRCACLFGIRSVDIYIKGWYLFVLCLTVAVEIFYIKISFPVDIPVVGSQGNFGTF